MNYLWETAVQSIRPAGLGVGMVIFVIRLVTADGPRTLSTTTSSYLLVKKTNHGLFIGSKQLH